MYIIKGITMISRKFPIERVFDAMFGAPEEPLPNGYISSIYKSITDMLYEEMDHKRVSLGDTSPTFSKVVYNHVNKFKLADFDGTYRSPKYISPNVNSLQTDVDYLIGIKNVPVKCVLSLNVRNDVVFEFTPNLYNKISWRFLSTIAHSSKTMKFDLLVLSLNRQVPIDSTKSYIIANSGSLWAYKNLTLGQFMETKSDVNFNNGDPDSFYKYNYVINKLIITNDFAFINDIELERLIKDSAGFVTSNDVYINSEKFKDSDTLLVDFVMDFGSLGPEEENNSSLLMIEEILKSAIYDEVNNE